MQTRIQMQKFMSEMKKKEAEKSDLMKRKMPVFAGRIAVNHVQDNFRKGGFQNGGLHKWKKSNREIYGGKGASAGYGTLMSARGHLYSSTKYVPAEARVTIQNDVIYAGAHNRGGSITTTVTPKMRKYAWYKYYALSGTGKSGKGGKGNKGAKTSDTPVAPDVAFWKNLALTKKTKISINMPQRQFLGHSQELNTAVRDKMDTELAKIFQK